MTRRKRRIQVPVGVEKLLYLAAQNEGFRARLLADRGAAIEESGVRLRESEAAALGAIDSAALEAMIDNIVPENPRRRKFMGLVAAAATSLAAGTAVISCDGASGDILGKGATGDTDVDGSTDTDTDADTDTDIDTDTDTDSDTDTGTATDTSTETDTVTDTDTVDTETDTEASYGATADTRVDGDFGKGE